MEIYQVSDNERFTYTYDSDTSLEDFTGGIYFVQMLNAPSRYNLRQSTETEIRDAVNRFKESGLKQEQLFRAVDLYAKLIGFIGVNRTVRGYSQSEWADVFIYCKPEHINGLPAFIEEYENYFRGDVYNISLERAKIYTAQDGETVTLWQEVETVGGFITDNQNDLNSYAIETFK